MRYSVFIRHGCIALLACVSFMTQAADNQSVDNTINKQEITSRFSKLGLNTTEIQASPIAGLAEVTTNQGVFYVTANGDYFLQGKLYGLDQEGNFTDLMAKKYAKMVEKFSGDMIVYPAKNEKYVVTVFTDITCGYCVKLHKDMQGYNDLGITVRYMAYPRQGPRGDVAASMAKVWCADDKKSALDAVKLNRRFDFDSKNLATCQKIIEEQYAFGALVGISGTPAILLPNGQLVGGYLPPTELIKTLESMR
ncbi:bifunctional protein-disulfide isomerase/oxidoreductase DsbC [Vibrio hibernica]|uniref:bifunctional protein-disulfide isomerase/oxidoreductase DsbC n=1 Tax=Vibrio hibernica TaxID=2587465 RepID=UPI0018817CF4|nr:bifunctional protein-disulfide isomerase/oxidoreductase DsbC [Vibrio hibernica]